ncbi:MAG: MarR family transcriptional regulator [Tissierellia bacterium]|nr:MarR family transcriptional regulator [Tissierellia bacterium]
MLYREFSDLYEKFKLNFYKNIFKGLGAREATLTATETFVVEVIHAMHRPTINELAIFLEMSQPNMTYKISNLVKKGYVKKIQSTEDKREFYLEVTDRFHNYYDMKNRYIKEVLKRLEKKISPEKLRDFEEILSLMNRELMPEVSKFIKTYEETEYEYRN